MAKNDTMWIVVAMVAVAFLVMNQPAADNGDSGSSGGALDLCKVVDAEVSFTGQRMFLAGTALTGQYVRVLRQNGGTVKDLGQTTMNSGTLSVVPSVAYKLYLGENESGADGTYYTGVKSYNAPCQDSTDDYGAVLCAIDVSPTVTVFDENGQVQSATANAQAVGASEIVDIEVKVKVNADECLGNPDAPSKNAVCFTYDPTVYDSVKASTPSTAIPYAIATSVPLGNATSCYELDLLADTASQTISVTIDANSNNPTQGENITVDVADVGFDLNADTLDEIWGFEDESNTNIGYNAAYTSAVIRIS